jgi:hypothetical protein
VREARAQLDLALEPAPLARAEHGPGEHLQRHHAPRGDLDRAVDDALAAAVELALDRVARDRRRARPTRHAAQLGEQACVAALLREARATRRAAVQVRAQLVRQRLPRLIPQLIPRLIQRGRVVRVSELRQPLVVGTSVEHAPHGPHGRGRSRARAAFHAWTA